MFFDQRAQGDRVGGEQEHLRDRRDLRLPALLRGLLPERVEVRGQRAVAEDLGVLGLEQGDHRRVTGREVGVGAPIDDRVAGLLDERHEAAAERIAVGVIRVLDRHDLVGRDAVPHRHEAALELLEAEEEHRACTGTSSSAGPDCRPGPHTRTPTARPWTGTARPAPGRPRRPGSSSPALTS